MTGGCRGSAPGPKAAAGEPRFALAPDRSTLPALGAMVSDAGYLGPEACAPCHQERYDSASKTSHFRSTRPATRAVTVAPLGEDVRLPSSVTPELRLVMIEQDGAMWQVGLDRERAGRIARRMDVVVGSGKLGQTFLTWDGPFLYQLPATFFTGVGWRFSPGYREDVLDFSRPVWAGCPECHTTWLQPGNPDLKYWHSYIGEPVWGVTCEKCHGPGRAHVEWHQAHPDDDTPHAIVSPGELDPARRDDICLLCHSERGEELQPAFSFRPGDNLRLFYASATDKPKRAGVPDLHTSNQAERLALSKCYQKSGRLGCVSCHDPHVYERGDDARFNARCMRCHAADKLSTGGRARHDGAAPCVDCHMPKKMTEIALRNTGDIEVRALMRDHAISLPPPP